MHMFLLLFYHTAVGLVASIATLINFIAPHGIQEADPVLTAESLVITGVSYKINEVNFTKGHVRLGPKSAPIKNNLRALFKLSY